MTGKQKDKEASATVKLPKIDMNTFNGNKFYFTELWDSFVNAIHCNNQLSGVEKLNYLKTTKLTGEARSSISGLSLANKNYAVGVDILQKRFGDKQRGNN